MKKDVFDASKGYVLAPGNIIQIDVAPAVAAVLAAQAQRLKQAKGYLEEIRVIEARMMGDRERLFQYAWTLGQTLTALKEEIGHGKWLVYLEGQWPEMSQQNAARYILFFKSNANHGNSGDLTFSTESIRKFMWDYIPVKERPELEGDAPVEPITHHLTFVNVFSKWDRQLSLGRVAMPPADVLRRECEPVVKRLAELLGPEYLVQVAAGMAKAAA